MHTQRPPEDQNFWNFLFSMFFVVVLGVATWGVHQLTGAWPHAVPWFDAVMMSFATLRITRLIVYDKIARWFRELFADTRCVDVDGVMFVEVKAYDMGFRHTIYDLLHCPWCIGVWSSLVVVFFYFTFPWAWTVIFFLALAGAGSLIQVVANAIGWSAENLKLEAKERDRDLRL